MCRGEILKNQTTNLGVGSSNLSGRATLRQSTTGYAASTDFTRFFAALRPDIHDGHLTTAIPSLDNLIRLREHSRWDGDAKSLCGLKVDHELMRQRCLNRYVAWIGPSEDLVGIAGHALRCVASRCAD